MATKIDLGQINSSDNGNKKNTPKIISHPLHSADKTQSTREKNFMIKDSLDNISVKSIKKRKKGKLKYFLLLFLLLFIAFLGYGGYKTFDALNNLKKGGVDVNIGQVINSAINKVTNNKNAGPTLIQSGDYTNVLLVGIDTRLANGTEGNTDSMIIASLNHKTNKVTMISVPRDNRVPYYMNNSKTPIYDRINAVYGVADSYNYPGGGLALLRKEITILSGIDINYTIQVNFNVLKELVDKVGGITVNVENSFTDYTYPKDDDSGVMTVSFKAGQQTMNGKTALEYARSRHSLDNGEGSDFSRAKRQQKVISAIVSKIKTTNFITDPNALSDFLSIFGRNVIIQKSVDSNSPSTNIDTNDISAALGLKDAVDTTNAISAVLDPNIGGLNSILAVVPNIDAYEIGPVLGAQKFTEVQKYVDFIRSTPDLYNENKPGYDAKNNANFAQIGLVDGGYGYSNILTESTKLKAQFLDATYASKTSAKIALSSTITVTPSSTDVPNTTSGFLSGVGIYDVTGKKPVTKDYLTKLYNATPLTSDQVPDSIKKVASDYDIILVFTK